MLFYQTEIVGGCVDFHNLGIIVLAAIKRKEARLFLSK